MEKKERIIFFGSGDFPRDTFEYLLKLQENKSYEIVGLVTSKGNIEDKGLPLSGIAEDKGIPFVMIKDFNESSFIREWCIDLNPTMFVVISFKKIPKHLLEIVNGRAFNVHASLLPLLRGANPIRWAIRHGLKETGLTAIELDDKIDNGRMLYSIVCPIKETDNYGMLKTKLQQLCCYITEKVIQRYDELPRIYQSNCGSHADIFYAPKVDKWYDKLIGDESPMNLLLSLAPYGGLKCKILVDERVKDNRFKIGLSYQRLEVLNCTVWNIHKRGFDEKDDHPLLVNYEDRGWAIDEIQLEGKKRMPFKDFLNGFKYAKPIPEDKGLRFKKYEFRIEL